MIKSARGAPGLPTNSLGVVPSEPLRHAEGYDEWRLDEALGETFPASDSIAVSPMHLLQAAPVGESGGVERSGRIPDRDTRRGRASRPAAAAASVDCEYCREKVSASVALSFEGADYVYHFCGPQCFAAWSGTANTIR